MGKVLGSHAGNKTPAKFSLWRAIRKTNGSGRSFNATSVARRGTDVAAQREKQALDGNRRHHAWN